MKVSHALETTHFIFVQLRSRKVAAIDMHGFRISAVGGWDHGHCKMDVNDQTVSNGVRENFN